MSGGGRGRKRTATDLATDPACSNVRFRIVNDCFNCNHHVPRTPFRALLAYICSPGYTTDTYFSACVIRLEPVYQAERVGHLSCTSGPAQLSLQILFVGRGENGKSWTMDGFGVELEGFLSVLTPYPITHIPNIYARRSEVPYAGSQLARLRGGIRSTRGFINRLGASIGSR